MSSSLDPKDDPITVAEVKAIAKQRLSKSAWNYFVTGADNESTLERNSAIYDEYVVNENNRPCFWSSSLVNMKPGSCSAPVCFATS